METANTNYNTEIFYLENCETYTVFYVEQMACTDAWEQFSCTKSGVDRRNMKQYRKMWKRNWNQNLPLTLTSTTTGGI
jgi:hypothetical protein